MEWANAVGTRGLMSLAILNTSHDPAYRKLDFVSSTGEPSLWDHGGNEWENEVQFQGYRT